MHKKLPEPDDIDVNNDDRVIRANVNPKSKFLFKMSSWIHVLLCVVSTEYVDVSKDVKGFTLTAMREQEKERMDQILSQPAKREIIS